jgi:hypothetical protein
VGVERKRKKKKKKEEEKIGFLTWSKPNPIDQIWAQAQSRPNCYDTHHCSQAQSNLGPEESKAQLKWAPATSKVR